MFQDRTLTCVECGMQFVFSAAEQERHAERGFANEPKRCPPCRQQRRKDRDPAGKGPREMHMATCSACGKEAMVPFAPDPAKPVYCDACFESHRPPRR